MARYRVDFVDHGENVYATHYVDHDKDEDAVKAAQQMHVQAIGAGFDVWDGERVVHQHRN
jgi:hypothetical protein